LYISEHVLNLDENNSAPFGILEVLMILIQLLSRTHGSDSPCLQNNYNAQSTPEVTVENTHPMPTNHDIPTIFTCGIVNLAKILMGVHECKCVCK
jgi:hypothetical protein